jgi:hypothetical protein
MVLVHYWNARRTPPAPVLNTAGAHSIPPPDPTQSEPGVAQRLESGHDRPKSRRLGTAMKRGDALLPEGESLRRAVAWLAEQPLRDLATIEEASRRFNLSPLDEQFLLEHFRGSAPGRTTP